MSKKICFKELLCLIFKVSFRALEFCENGNERFESWSQAKNILNYRLNRAVFLYLSRRSFSGGNELDQEMESQFVLDAISEIILKHFTRRCEIYRFTKIRGFSHEKLFILMSLIATYCTGFVEIIRCFRNLGIRYRLDGSIDPGSVCLAINFPAHGFSIPDRMPKKNEELAKPFSSFGEFLLHYVSVNGKRSVLSLGEYTRRSKKVEAQTKTPTDSPARPVKEFPRLVVRKSRSILDFLVDLGESLGRISLWEVNLLWKAEVVLEVNRLLRFVQAIKYKKFISHLMATGRQVEAIFTVPFEDALGCLKYDPEVRKNTFTFNYSDNLFIPPSQHIQAVKSLNQPFEVKELLSEISLSAFRLTGGVVGFTDVFYLMGAVRKIIRDKYGIILPDGARKKSKQRAAVLGYEIGDLNLKIGSYKNIVVFDVPPESRRQQLSRALVGDRICDLKFIEEFFLDIADFVHKNNVCLLFKPKYSLTNYSSEYQLLIRSIKKRLINKFILMSPYTRIGSIMDIADVCLCLPYTSPRSIGAEFGKQSFYYVPERYRDEFNTSFDYSYSLIGRSDLDQRLFHADSCSTAFP
ncbi:MAG: hypothetical protein ACOY4M_09325 [Pseudomonadota bacterium]